MKPTENPIVIIGNGCAAAECVIALRENGYAGAIQMFADNALPPANPMLTTYYASGRIGYEAMFPYGEDFYRRYRAEFHPDEPVTALHNPAHEIETARGRYPYSCCLAASGASALRPPIPGVGLERVLTVRTPQEAERLRRAGEARPGRVLVVGASMVGIKVVEMFYDLGSEVVLADLAPQIFPLAAGRECAFRIEEKLRRRGIGLRFSAQLTAIEPEADGSLTAVFGDGTREHFDYIAMCAGVRANLGYIDVHTLAVNRGILVDQQMRTSDPDVFAAGDTAQAADLSSGQPAIIGLLANAREQGRAAAFAMLGKTLAFPGSFPCNITHFFDIDFVGIGDVRRFDEEERIERAGVWCQFFYTGGRLTGVNTLGSMLASGAVKDWMTERALAGRLPEGPRNRQQELLRACALQEAGWKGEVR